SILYFLLRVFADVSLTNVLAAYAMAAIAALVIHIPAGLGIIEGTFILAFGNVMSKHDILAAILAVRGLYHFIPFALALVRFGLCERSARELHRLAPGHERSGPRDRDRFAQSRPPFCVRAHPARGSATPSRRRFSSTRHTTFAGYPGLFPRCAGGCS